MSLCVPPETEGVWKCRNCWRAELVDKQTLWSNGSTFWQDGNSYTGSFVMFIRKKASQNTIPVLSHETMIRSLFLIRWWLETPGPQILKVGRQLTQMLGTLMSVEVWKLFNTCKKGVDDLCGKDKERMISRCLSPQRSWAILMWLISLRKYYLSRNKECITKTLNLKIRNWRTGWRLSTRRGVISLYDRGI